MKRSLPTAGAVLCALLALAGCGGGSSNSSSSSTSVTAAKGRSGPISIFEAEAQLRGTPAQTAQNVDVLRKLGVDVIRLYMPWNQLAPNPDSRKRPKFNAADPASYSAATWAIYDTIIRNATARGLGIDLTVGAHVPLWATGPHAPPGGPHLQWEPSASEYGQFMQAVGKRYSGSYKPPGSSTPLPRVKFWAVWNEPNYGVDLAPQAIDHSTVEVAPRLYRGLVNAAWSALQATGHSHDTFLIGETAPRGLTTGNNPGNFSGMVPLRFIRALYCVGSNLKPLQGQAAEVRGCPVTASASKRFVAENPGLFHATGFADHPYPQGQIAPNVKTTAEPDYADLAALDNLEHTLDSAQEAYGSKTKFPIYSTEFGLQTNPPERIARAIDSKTAAYYLNWSEYISWRNPRVYSYDQYLLTDPPGGNFATGLEYANGEPKPQLYDAYRLPLYLPVTRAHKGQSLEVWGDVRPARFTGRDTGKSQQVKIEFQAGSKGAFKTLQTLTITNPHGYFDTRMSFPGSGIARLTWTYPNGETIHSRPVSVTVS
ncbi:MAG: hypothetical protein ACXVHB_26230 [Solirubrobacteraceae bacterium]